VKPTDRLIKGLYRDYAEL